MATSEQLMKTAFGADDDDEIIEFIQNSDIIMDYFKKVLEYIGKGGVELNTIEPFNNFQLFITNIQSELKKKKILIILILSLIATSKPGKEGELAYILQKTLDYNFNLYIAYKALLQTMNKLLVMLKKKIIPMEQAEEVVGGGLQNGGQPVNFFTFGIQILFGLMLISFYLTTASAQPTPQELAKETIITMDGNGAMSVDGKQVANSDSTRATSVGWRAPGSVSSFSSDGNVAIRQTDSPVKFDFDTNTLNVIPVAELTKTQISRPGMFFPGFAEYRGCYEKGLFGSFNDFDENGLVTSEKKAYELEDLNYKTICPSGASPYMKEKAAKFDKSLNSFREEPESSKEKSVVAKTTSEGIILSFAVPGDEEVTKTSVVVPAMAHLGSCYNQTTAQEYLSALTAYREILESAYNNASTSISTMLGHLNKEDFTKFIKEINSENWPSKTSMPQIKYTFSSENEKVWEKRFSTASVLTSKRLQTMADTDFENFKKKINYAMKQIPEAKIMLTSTPPYDKVVTATEGTNQETITVKCHSVNVLIASTYPDIPALLTYKNFIKNIGNDIKSEVNSGNVELQAYASMIDNVELVIDMSMELDKYLTGKYVSSIKSVQDIVMKLTTLYQELSKIALDPSYSIKQSASSRSSVLSATLESAMTSNKGNEKIYEQMKKSNEMANKFELLESETDLALKKAQKNLQRQLNVEENWFVNWIKDFGAIQSASGWEIIMVGAKLVGVIGGVYFLIAAGKVIVFRGVRISERLLNFLADRVEGAIPQNQVIQAAAQNAERIEDVAAQNPANNQQEQLALDDIVPGQGQLAINDIVNPNQAQGLGVFPGDDVDEGAIGDIHNALGPQLGQQNQNPLGGRRSRQTKKLMRYRKTKRTGNKTRKNKKQRKQTKKRRRQIKNKKNTKRN